VYFKEAKSDFTGALQYYQTAYSLAESTGHPTSAGYYALASICGILIINGKPLSAITHSKEAYRYAEHIGDIYGQAWSLRFQGTSHIYLANYQHAQHLLQKSKHILATLGHKQSALNLSILNLQAEIHLVKSEYLESHKLQVAIASSCQATSYYAILANLNKAFIDITTGADSNDSVSFKGSVWVSGQTARHFQ
jgi:tetratricopeptide (TPR) repeat protein